MSAKHLKFFGPPTTKWRPSKIFAKLYTNHLLMANIFKLHKYQTFGLMKMHKEDFSCNFAKPFKGRDLMGHSGTDLKFSIAIDL